MANSAGGDLSSETEGTNVIPTHRCTYPGHLPKPKLTPVSPTLMMAVLHNSGEVVKVVGDISSDKVKLSTSLYLF